MSSYLIGIQGKKFCERDSGRYYRVISVGTRRVKPKEPMEFDKRHSRMIFLEYENGRRFWEPIDQHLYDEETKVNWRSIRTWKQNNSQ